MGGVDKEFIEANAGGVWQLDHSHGDTKPTNTKHS